MNGPTTPTTPQTAPATISTPPTFSGEWWATVPRALSPILIAFAVFVVAVLSAWLYPPYIRTKGDPSEWVKPIMSEMESNIVITAEDIPKEQQQRLLAQAGHVSGRAQHHFKVMRYYYTNYYVSLLLRAVYGGLAAIALFLLTKGGWQQGGAALAAFFLSATVCSIFFFAFPAWCEMDNNVTKNKALYVRYVGLLNDMRTYAAIRTYAQDPQPTNQVTVTNFILRMDAEMKKANDIAVAFDATKGPVYNISTGEKSPK